MDKLKKLRWLGKVSSLSSQLLLPTLIVGLYWSGSGGLLGQMSEWLLLSSGFLVIAWVVVKIEIKTTRDAGI